MFIYKFYVSSSSIGKESIWNAGDLGLIPGLGRSTEERIGYPLRYSWASFVAQLVKNPPAMQETWVWSLGWEDPLEKGKATHPSILAWRIPWLYSPQGHKESDTTEQLSLESYCMMWSLNCIHFLLFSSDIFLYVKGSYHTQFLKYVFSSFLLFYNFSHFLGKKDIV